ncbi:CBS domain-containing protein [Rhodopseudomonas sp.]|uniref:CBS domain-containing protein n=1 Tax=Rhodopseudomonas sp. TaxID=1078 RepID=UPI003B3AF2F4
MKAADVMTTRIVTVRPNASVRTVAETLLAHGISAVPVVDEAGAPLGIISEGDLMPRNEKARESRRDWWLQMLSEGDEVHPDYLQFLKSDHRTAAQIMVSPVLTVDESVPIAEIADLLYEKNIKRVPVLREGRVVGIVSRADLLKTLAGPAHAHPRDPVHDDGSMRPVASDALEALSHRGQVAAPPPPHNPSSDEISATAFQQLGVEHERHEEELRREAKRVAEEKHHRQASQMLATHLTDEAWEHMMHNARAMAKKGEADYLLLRFPAELCTDHGRAINVPDPEWPSTLRGMAADIYLRWKSELRPHGFSLTARVVDFPEGIPGDIGLFLSWAKKED